MRTNIEINDDLLAKAMKATRQTTKKATVEAALQKVVQLSEQRQALEEMRGMGWDGDLDAMRNDWSPSVDWSK